jgi:hypothetical protein
MVYLQHQLFNLVSAKRMSAFFHLTCSTEATEELIKSGQLSFAVISCVYSLLACGVFRALGSVAAEYYLFIRITEVTESKNFGARLAIR